MNEKKRRIAIIGAGILLSEALLSTLQEKTSDDDLILLDNLGDDNLEKLEEIKKESMIQFKPIPFIAEDRRMYYPDRGVMPNKYKTKHQHKRRK